MKYSEFKKAVEGLSKHYSVIRNCGSVDVDYKNHTVLEVPAHQFTVVRMESYEDGYIDRFRDSLPYSHRLWMLAAEYSMTPVEECKEHRWNVIIGQGSNHEKCYYRKFGDEFIMQWIYDVRPHDSLLEFSDEDFSRLIKTLRSTPRGASLAKIAELGKVPAPKVD